jgi:hypothetical protein
MAMATLSTLKRLARLGGWIGLSAGAMVAAACGAMLGSGCDSTPLGTSDAQPDSTSKRDSLISLPGPDAGVRVDAPAPRDAGEADMWTIICE